MRLAARMCAPLDSLAVITGGEGEKGNEIVVNNNKGRKGRT